MEVPGCPVKMDKKILILSAVVKKLFIPDFILTHKEINLSKLELTFKLQDAIYWKRTALHLHNKEVQTILAFQHRKSPQFFDSSLPNCWTPWSAQSSEKNSPVTLNHQQNK